MCGNYFMFRVTYTLHILQPRQTYERRDNVLVTQVPLHDTVSDFWSLVIDQYCNVLLVLDSLDTNANKVHFLLDQSVYSWIKGTFS